MQDRSTFACCHFAGASTKLALPVEHVQWVHDDDRDAPHICDILSIEREDREIRVLELQSFDDTRLFLSVDLPIGVDDVAVDAVLPRSAAQVGECTQGVIQRDGELTLLLDGEKISNVLRALSTDSETEAKD